VDNIKHEEIFINNFINLNGQLIIISKASYKLTLFILTTLHIVIDNNVSQKLFNSIFRAVEEV